MNWLKRKPNTELEGKADENQSKLIARTSDELYAELSRLQKAERRVLIANYAFYRLFFIGGLIYSRFSKYDNFTFVMAIYLLGEPTTNFLIQIASKKMWSFRLKKIIAELVSRGEPRLIEFLDGIIKRNRTTWPDSFTTEYSVAIIRMLPSLSGETLPDLCQTTQLLIVQCLIHRDKYWHFGNIIGSSRNCR